MTEKLGPDIHREVEESADCDLARRLARYRRRVEAEGRLRSVKLIDRAIEDAEGEGVRRAPSAGAAPLF